MVLGENRERERDLGFWERGFRVLGDVCCWIRRMVFIKGRRESRLERQIGRL